MFLKHPLIHGRIHGGFYGSEDETLEHDWWAGNCLSVWTNVPPGQRMNLFRIDNLCQEKNITHIKKSSDVRKTQMF